MAAAPNQVKAVFLDAVEVPAAERAAFLDMACGGDEALRRRVGELLAAHAEGSRFLHVAAEDGAPADVIHEHAASPASAPADASLVASQCAERPGAAIGPYKLLEQIGEGGFGVVFMAEQHEPVRRNVALKVIKPGMDTRQVIARFEAERQALALMDHPNIAKIFDAGTTPPSPLSEQGAWGGGRPYFVMELVQGAPITTYCDQNCLSVRRRLELFVAVCRAIEHAHQKGVIHRDIKPNNVLVASVDGAPLVKVIDFGVAKATGKERLTAATLDTRVDQRIGTPLYMSPEQADASGRDVDTRTDIYSLGVLLYELLTGATPFDQERLRTLGFDEISRVIREEDPPKPSARLSALGQAMPTVSAQRAAEARRLAPLLRGDLDWIVMKALEKDRARRYPTANALADDVLRHLRDEPVEAGPPSPGYRLGKFVRRHRAATLVAVGAAVLLVLAIASLTAGLVVIHREQQETKKAWHAESLANQALQESLQREQKNLHTLRLALARQHWLTGDLARAKQYLEECPITMRDREWRILRRACFAELLRIDAHKIARKVYFSPDGTRLATLNYETSTWNQFTKAGLWDAGTGKLIRLLSEPGLSFFDIAFTPDGTKVVTVGKSPPVISGAVDERGTEGTIEICHWDSSTGQSVRGPLRLPKASRTFFLSPDGRHLAIRGLADDIWIADTNSAAYVSGFNTGPGPPTWVLNWSPDGRFVALASGENWIVFDSKTQQVARGPARSDKFSRLAVSPDGRRLAVATYSRGDATALVKLWDVAANQELATLQPPFTNLHEPTFSPDGRWLALVQIDHVIGVWDVQTKQEIFSFRGHTNMINHLAFSPDGRRLASASSDGTVRVWDTSPLEDEPEPIGAGRQ